MPEPVPGVDHVICIGYSRRILDQLPGNKKVRCCDCSRPLVAARRPLELGLVPICVDCAKSSNPGGKTAIVPGTRDEMEPDVRDLADELDGIPVSELSDEQIRVMRGR